MDSINWKRLGLLVVVGLALGFGAARAVEATGWNPLVAPIVSMLAAGAVGVALGKAELLNFLLEDGLFVYFTYIGMSIVRAVGIHNYVATHIGDPRASQLLNGVNVVVAAAGIPYMLVWFSSSHCRRGRLRNARHVAHCSATNNSGRS